MRNNLIEHYETISYLWTIPETIPNGSNYKIVIYIGVIEDKSYIVFSLCEWNNDFFTIGDSSDIDTPNILIINIPVACFAVIDLALALILLIKKDFFKKRREQPQRKIPFQKGKNDLNMK